MTYPNPDERGFRCRDCGHSCTRREAEMGRCDECQARRRLAERQQAGRADCAEGEASIDARKNVVLTLTPTEWTYVYRILSRDLAFWAWATIEHVGRDLLSKLDKIEQTEQCEAKQTAAKGEVQP